MRAIAIHALIAASSVVALSACTMSPYSPSGANALDTSHSVNPGAGSASCDSLFTTVLTRERTGDTAGAINAELADLGDRCPGRYQVFVDYVSIKGFAEIDAGGACSDYAEYDVEAEAVRLASQDGFCSAGGPVQNSTEAAAWNCVYSPTYNDDWHDDVVCSNGAEQVRPYLREWDRFVTEVEIMESAREYEAQLNVG